MICAICGKKQSSWIEDFPLSPELQGIRICATCNDTLVKFRKAEMDAEDISQFEAYLKNTNSLEVKEYIESLFRKAEEAIEEQRKEIENIALQKKQQEEEEMLFNKNLQEIMLTTGNNFDGYKVEKYIDVICEEVVFKNSFWKSFEASFEDLGNSLSFKEKEMSGAGELISNARAYAMEKFKAKAVKLNANAVLAIDLENSFGRDVVRVSIFGTAVQIKKIE